jgi:hypothetical protein
MKQFLFILSCIIASFTTLSSQTFTNIASQVGINAKTKDLYYIPGGGAGFADYDNDGDADVIIATSTHFKVYRNNNFSFTDVTAQSGIAFYGDCLKSVVWGDYNNDGWRDVYLTSWYSGNKLCKNNGNGTFTDVTDAAGVGVPQNYQSTAAAWGDVNRDGLLDLYVCNYGNIEGLGEQPNILFKNNGNGTFSDITAVSGSTDSLYKKPLAVVIFDYNMDGWQDIYIAMDKYQRSTLFKNTGNGVFQDVTWVSGTMCFFDAMGIAVGDYNHDGLFDMHVSNGPPGNATFRNNGNGTFTNTAVQTGTTVNKECWGNLFFDYNNDGWCDLFATAAAGIDMCDVLLKNNGNNTFSNIGYSIGIADSAFSYGAARCDFNNDGYSDFLVVMSDSNSHFYKNSGGTSKWLKLKCTGVQSNRDAIGSVVTVYAGGIMNRQVLLGGTSYLSSDDVVLIFGLSSSNIVDSVVINWTNGGVDRSYNLAPNALYTAVEGSGVIGIQTISANIPAEYKLYQNYPNPFNPVTKIKFDLSPLHGGVDNATGVRRGGLVKLIVYNLLGQEITTLINEQLSPGTYEVDFNSTGYTSGIYFYTLKAGSFSETKRMILLK